MITKHAKVFILLFFIKLFYFSAALSGNNALFIEMLLEREEVGNLVVIHDRELLVFEKTVPLNQNTNPLPHVDHYSTTTARKKLFIQSLDGKNIPELLFPQDEDAGYFLPINTELSPDGRYLPIAKLKNGALSLGVYDWKNSKSIFAEYSTKFIINSSSMIWLSNHEALIQVLSNDEDQSRLDHGVHGLRGIANAREDAWAGKTATASALGGGRYFKKSIHLQTIKLVRYNFLTNRGIILDEENYDRLLLSPDKKHLAVQLIKAREALSPNEVPNLNSGVQTYLYIYNIEEGKKLDTITKKTADLKLVSWSQNGEHLLYSADLNNNKKTYHVYNITKYNSSYNYHGTNFFKNKKEVKSAIWVNNKLVFSANDLNTNRIDWFYQKSSSLLNLTKNFPLTPDEVLTTNENSVFFLFQGDVWQVNLDGTIRNITVDIKFPLQRDFIGDYITRNLPIDEIPFSFTTEHGERNVILLSETGSIVQKLIIPRKDITLKYLSTDGIVFNQNSEGVGSTLYFARSAEPKSVITLFEYNAHLSNVPIAKRSMPLKHKGVNGASLTSWLFLPAANEANTSPKYPLIMIPYAGQVYHETPPSTVYAADKWKANIGAPTSVEVFTSAGYAVLLPSIPLTRPGVASDQFTDLLPPVLSAVEAATETGYIDENRLAMSGHSHGGFSVYSIAAQTDIFNVGIVTAGPSNWISMYGQFSPLFKFRPDRPLPGSALFIESGFGRTNTTPWEGVDRYIHNSPLFYADDIKTPLMIIHGDVDFVQMQQAEEMFTALARQNKDVLFIRFWGEGHTIENPKNIKTMWKYVFDFLSEYGVFPRDK